MDRCVLLTSTRELMSTTHTYPWLIPIITWCRQFLSVPTNILLIKSKLKLESRAIIVGDAPTPGGESARTSFFSRELERVNRTASEEWCHRLHGDNILDHVVCLKAEFLWHTVLSENGEFYTYDIDPFLNRSVCFLMGLPIWWKFTFCSSGGSFVFWWRDAPLLRELQMWGRQCKQWASHWFQGHKMRFGGIWSTMSW